LVKQLSTHGIKVFPPRIIAETGWTTADLLSALDAAPPPASYNLVSLLIGVNNQYQGLDLKSYRGEFVELLQRAIGYARQDSGRVLVLSIPDWGLTPFASDRDQFKIHAEIDAHNHVNHEESKRVGVHYVDVTPISRQRGAETAMLVEDGLHPSGKMYALWVDLVFPVVLRILQKP
jgi:lysophospholipase L1-like esterase